MSKRIKSFRKFENTKVSKSRVLLIVIVNYKNTLFEKVGII